MTAEPTATPYRADQIGSFLRPAELLEARRGAATDPERLRALEDLHVLPQQAECAVDQNAAGLGNMPLGHRRKQRRLPDAIAADETCSLGSECQIDVGEKSAAVRREQRQVRQDD